VPTRSACTAAKIRKPTCMPRHCQHAEKATHPHWCPVGAGLAAHALTENGMYKAAEVNFTEIAAATTHSTPDGAVLEGRATLLMPFGPNYDDNDRPGVSADSTPPCSRIELGTLDGTPYP